MTEAYDSVWFDCFRMGIDIDDVIDGKVDIKPSKICNLLFQQPQGAEVWKEIGGWMAATPEEYRLVMLDDHLIQIAHAYSGSKSKPPKGTPVPVGRIEERIHREKQAETFVEKAVVFQQVLEDEKEDVEKALAMWGDDWNKGASKFDEMRQEAQNALGQWDKTKEPQPEVN